MSLQTSASVEHAATGAQLVPWSVELSNSAVPVGSLGVSPPGVTTFTVASTVTICPLTEGLADVAIPVTVDAELTVWVTGDEVEPVKSRLRSRRPRARLPKRLQGTR